MSKERSEKCCFQSKFGGGWITASQLLAEMMCERSAKADGDHLADKFWQDPYWIKKFKAQMNHANKLLTLYPIDAILRAVAHKDMKRVYSLGLKSVIEPLIKRELYKMKVSREVDSVRENTENKSEEVPKASTLEKPRPSFNMKQSSLKKLRELE